MPNELGYRGDDTVPDLSHIEPDHCIHKEKRNNQRAWLAVETIRENPPAKLQKWLQSEGIDEIPDRDRRRMDIIKELKKQGVYEEGMEWKRKITSEMGKWKVASINHHIAREIAWRLVEAKVFDFLAAVKVRDRNVIKQQQDKDEALDANVIEGMEFLPGWMRWCILHPGLLHDPDDIISDPILSSACKKYTDRYPCPHQAAMHQFLLHQNDKDRVERMFREIGKLHLTTLKQVKTAPDKAEGTKELTAEGQAIATLESLFDAHAEDDQ